MEDTTYTLDDATFASNPGELKVSKWRWILRYPKWPLRLFFALVASAGLIALHWGFAIPALLVGFANFLYWFHFANGTLQAQMGRNMILNRLKLADDNPILQANQARVDRAFDLVNARLGETEYLAGREFTAADIMIGFSLTTMRYFLPYDIGRCPNIVRYLAGIGQRPAYRRAMEKGDPGMKLLLT